MRAQGPRSSSSRGPRRIRGSSTGFGLGKGCGLYIWQWIYLSNTYGVPDEGLELPWWWFWESLPPVITKSDPYLCKPYPLPGPTGSSSARSTAWSRRRTRWSTWCRRTTSTRCRLQCLQDLYNISSGLTPKESGACETSMSPCVSLLTWIILYCKHRASCVAFAGKWQTNFDEALQTQQDKHNKPYT